MQNKIFQDAVPTVLSTVMHFKYDFDTMQIITLYCSLRLCRHRPPEFEANACACAASQCSRPQPHKSAAYILTAHALFSVQGLIRCSCSVLHSGYIWSNQDSALNIFLAIGAVFNIWLQYTIYHSKFCTCMHISLYFRTEWRKCVGLCSRILFRRYRRFADCNISSYNSCFHRGIRLDSATHAVHYSSIAKIHFPVSNISLYVSRCHRHTTGIAPLPLVLFSCPQTGHLAALLSW